MAKESQKAKPKKPASGAGLFISFFALGGVLGYFAGQQLDVGKPFGENLLHLGAIASGVFAAIYLQMLLHEAGHLLFGLATGYKFVSFRIGSFVWIKIDGRVRLRRMALAGTGGQCLLDPPDWQGEKTPFALYNLGGSFANLAVAAVFGGLYAAFEQTEAASALFLPMAAIGLFFSTLNGVPLRLGMMNNDGDNALSIARGKKTGVLRALWLQLKIHAQTAKGVRLKDMPDEWFAPIPGASQQESLVKQMEVLACSRLLDALNIDLAKEKMAALFESEGGLVGLQRNMLAVDAIFCELVSSNSPEAVQKLMDKAVLKFMKAMRKFPSVIRTQYALALLRDKDAEKAARFKAVFGKAAAQHPYPSDIQSERELMEYAAKSAEGGQA
jgi:hypothetical protein